MFPLHSTKVLLTSMVVGSILKIRLTDLHQQNMHSKDELCDSFYKLKLFTEDCYAKVKHIDN